MQWKKTANLAILAWCLAMFPSDVGDSLFAQETKTETPATVSFEPLAEPTGLQAEWTGPAKSLLSGNDLGSWESISFGGEGDCAIKDGILSIESGDPLTGVALADKSLPNTNYELSLESRRTEGIDFFCGLAFPVNDSHCCLIVGGWAGSVVGLSNIDDEDASSNDTRKLASFDDEQWYKIRIRVMPNRIITWIDDKCIIDKDITGKKISLRGDTLSLRPLGICTFQTSSQIRKLTIRQFKPTTEPAKRTHQESHQSP